MKIIYKNKNGGVSIVIPNSSYNTINELQELAKKDVPTGLAYKIVNDYEIPTDRTFRDAWTVDEATLTDGVGK